MTPQVLAREVPLEKFYAQTVLIRAVEQTLLNLFSQGEISGTVHTCVGQEWVGVAVAAALQPRDHLFSNHRCHGHYLARTGDVEGLLAEVMGRQSGVCGGRGGSQHLCATGFYSNGVQGGMVPVACGMALALKRSGQPNIAVAFIGDGTLGEGVVYEALNVASKWELPILVVLENNRYAQSTPIGQNLAGDVDGRAAAFGIPIIKSSTWEPEDLLERSRQAVNLVREHRTPVFLHVQTDRLMAHSKGDDTRDPRTLLTQHQRDPVARFLDTFPESAQAMTRQSSERVSQALALARRSPWASKGANHFPCPAANPPIWSEAPPLSPDRVVNRIHAALQRNMQQDERIILLGEDIEGAYGGAFKVTRNLSAEFPGRVRNTPISEAALVGLGNGLAMAGLRPVCEIMFGDFLTLAADQIINHAAKFRYLFNDQVQVPLIIRTPMGGRRGYGATHSQSLEKHFLGLPDTQMLALHHRFDPGLLYDRLFATVDRPTLVIENKLLYGVHGDMPVPRGFRLEHNTENFPTTRLRPEGITPDLTIVCYGGMLIEVEKAVQQLFDEDEIVCEVICPTQLYPLDIAPILESVRKSARLLLVEEGLSFAALGAEIAAQILEKAPGAVRAMSRLGSPCHPIPSCGPLEKELLPGAAHVQQSARDLVLPA